MFLRYVCVKQTAWTRVSFMIYGHDRCLKGLKTVRVVGEYKTHPVDHEWRSMRVFHAMFHYIFNKIIECDVKPCRWPERRCFVDYFHIINLSIKPRGSLRIPLNHPSTPSITMRNIKSSLSSPCNHQCFYRRTDRKNLIALVNNDLRMLEYTVMYPIFLYLSVSTCAILSSINLVYRIDLELD